MKHKGLRSLLMALMLCMSTGVMAEKQNETQVSSKEFDVQKISEAFGHLIGDNLETPGFKFDLDSIIKGMRDSIEGVPSPMTQEEYEEAITTIQEKAFNALSDENLKNANSFLNQNAQENSVVEVESGKLQYKVEKDGTGEEVFEHSAPLIHYTGTFIDGTVFGSSLENGEPITLPLSQTIAGFSKGIVGMKEGEKRTLFIHPELGYGTTGHLPPNSLLIFEVEVVKANNEAIETEVISQTDTYDEATNS